MRNWRYFETCHTCEDVKARYKELAKKLHPDCGGDAESFKAMSAEYERAFEAFKNIHVNAEGEQYEKQNTESADIFKNIIDKIIHFEGVKIEIIGSWIWLSGSTMLYKDEIKTAGFWWSKSKRAWYYNGSDKKTTRRGRYSMNGLRAKWGYTEVETEEQKKLA